MKFSEEYFHEMSSSQLRFPFWSEFTYSSARKNPLLLSPFSLVSLFPASFHVDKRTHKFKYERRGVCKCWLVSKRSLIYYIKLYIFVYVFTCNIIWARWQIYGKYWQVIIWRSMKVLSRKWCNYDTMMIEHHLVDWTYSWLNRH